jgi:hypothetical protein
VSGPSSPPTVAERGWGRWLPVLLVPLALLPDLAAALPLRTYYFRDFTATFYPLRLFAAREIREGRFALWNPYIFEGSFQIPVLYPPDLLHALWPSPVWFSWLLTLHLPLAAIAAWWLARELGASRASALLGGAVYALGGFALSCLNLYVFLQALALAPLVVGLLRRAAAEGGRAVVAAGLGLALALSTLAVEFVGQAWALGVALGLATPPRRVGGLRLLAASAVGVGLAGLPLALTLGLLPETARGAGFPADVRLGNAVHPAVLLQTLMPNLFGVPQAPAEAWWGGRFFSKGLPYFLSLYLGPLVLGLAGVGLTGMRRPLRTVLLVLGGLGLWYSLGARGGLAPLVSSLPLAEAFRFPSKALLLPYLAVAVGAAFGADRLRRERGAWARLAALGGSAAALALAVAVLCAAAPPAFVAWTGIAADFWGKFVEVVTRDAALAVALALTGAVLALAVYRGSVGRGVATVLLSALVVADLARAGAGLNPQAPASFFEPLPEMKSLHLDELGGERVFSYGLDHSPAFRAFLSRGGRRLTLAGTYLSRQVLAPYSNVVDRVETPEATDLTSFVPRSRELGPDDYDPRAAGRLLPWLRNAAVGRVISLDPLSAPDLEELAVIPAGPPDLAIHVYGVTDPWPRAYLACRAVHTPAAAALSAPFREGYDPRRDVVLEGPARASCRRGAVLRTALAPGRERFAVKADGAGYLVTRASYAPGWRAWVDGRETPVLRAQGKHRAVSVPAGEHEVVLRYRPPGLRAGLVATVVSSLVALVLWRRSSRVRRG